MKHIALVPLPFLILLTPSTSLTIPPQTPHLPSANLATPLLHSWLNAFNTINASTIETFYNTSFGPFQSSPDSLSTCFSLPRSPCQDIHISNWTGGFSLVDLESTPSNAELSVFLQEKNSTQYWVASIAVNSSENDHSIRITELDLRPVMTPLRMIPKSDPRRASYEKGLQPLTSQIREKIVGEITNLLREKYVDPLRGEALSSILSESLRNGSYDSFSGSEDFSLRLNGDLNKNGDRRGWPADFFVYFNEPLKHDEEKEKRAQQNFHEEMNYGFGDVDFNERSIEGKIVATLPITHLFRFDESRIPPVVIDKMNSLSNADVLILDLRGCFGLDMHTAAFILSHLFDETVVLTNSVDRSGMRHVTMTYPASELRLGEGGKIFGGQKSVYVLTNNRTAFEAEGIAYSLQAYGRGKVVGEQEATMGWANPEPVRHAICEDEFGDGWWSVFAQDMKLVHHVTKSSWDGVGVKSDILAGWEEGSDRARDVAIALEKSKGREVQEEL